MSSDLVRAPFLIASDGCFLFSWRSFRQKAVSEVREAFKLQLRRLYLIATDGYENGTWLKYLRGNSESYSMVRRNPGTRTQG